MLLIAIKSCARDMQNLSHQAIRESWGKDVQDLRFFIGQEPTGSFAQFQDEINLNVDDSYQGLAKKTRKILEWSLAQGYEFTFLADNDTFAIPDLLLHSKFQNAEYSGKIAPNRGGRPFLFCHGGYGYFVSRKLAELAVKTEPTVTDEDRFVGQVAFDNGIVPHALEFGTFHFPTIPYRTRYNPGTKWQELMYKKYVLRDESIRVNTDNSEIPVNKEEEPVQFESGYVLIRRKGSGKGEAVTADTARRLVFKGQAVYV
jgi:hypothetical protein